MRDLSRPLSIDIGQAPHVANAVAQPNLLGLGPEPAAGPNASPCGNFAIIQRQLNLVLHAHKQGNLPGIECPTWPHRPRVL